MDPREKLLQDLMKQLETYKLPERYDETKKKQIMKGRKGQAEIDKGRETIGENEQLFQQAIDRRQVLQKQIADLQTEIDDAGTTKRKQAQEDWERSPEGQAYEIGKWTVPALGGMYYGHKSAKDIEKRQANMSPSKLQAMGTARRFAPHAAKAMTYFIPEGLALREYVAPRMEEGVAQDLVNAGGVGLLASGAITVGEGAARALTPPKIPGVDDALPPPSSPGGQPRTPPGPRLPPSAASAATNSETLINAARAAGGKGIKTKQDAADYLLSKDQITSENRGRVGRALRVGSGPNFANRIAQKVKDLAATTRHLPGVIGPVVGGALAYDAVSSDAEARGATPAEAMTRGTAAAVGTGAATGGVLYGARKLAESPLVQQAMKRVAPPLAAYGFGEQAYDEFQNPSEMGEFDSTFGQETMSDYEAYRQERGEAPNPKAKRMPASVAERIQRMSDRGARPDQIADYLNRIAP